MGISDAQAHRYADLLEGALMIRQLRPWHEELLTHPRVGASWEGFMIEQLRRSLRAQADEHYYWRTHDGAELDLLFMRGSRRVGFEIKRTATPRMTPSMHHALRDLRLDSLYVVHSGEHRFPMHERVEAIPWSQILDLTVRVAGKPHLSAGRRSPSLRSPSAPRK